MRKLFVTAYLITGVYVRERYAGPVRINFDDDVEASDTVKAAANTVASITSILAWPAIIVLKVI